MMVHAFRKGIVPRPFSESLIRNRPKTFGDIRRRAVAHIVVEGEVIEKRTYVVPTRPRAPGRPQPMRVHEATTEKRAPAKQQPYEPRKPQTRGHARENVPPRHNFVVELKDLIAVPNIAERLKIPAKTAKKLGPNKNAWWEFHQAFGHPIRNCLALGHQLDEPVKSGILNDYFAESQGAPNSTVSGEDQGHEIPVHGKVHTIAGAFSGGGCTASQWKKYARAVMSVEAQEADDALDVNLVFTRADLRDVVPHNNDPVVISLVTAGRKIHHVEVRGHLELRITFTDGAVSRTENIRYLVVNAPSTYSILLGRPTLNRLRAVTSTRHMKMKLPDLGGKVITIKSDQKKAKRCYENNLKTKRGVFMVTTRAPIEEGVAPSEIARSEIPRERRPEPAGEVLERKIGGKTFKLGKSLGRAA
ncbi:uncharacterized protein [Phaseolus vulgaris]|uniref:uncharacterized protein n=1 Tax=Phaseolus vulgaris TaxID=3885 RepID=UPI0035C9A1E7